MTATQARADAGLRARRQWMDAGTGLLLGAVGALDDEALSAPSALPGWTRRHVIAHVAANADALTRLAGWAKTGREQRMYASPEQRAAEIEAGSARPAAQLRRWLQTSARTLQDALDALGDPDWVHQVITAQGRRVPALELPWMRAREVLVHAVDLDAGVTFAALPSGFTAALVDDVAAARRRSPGLAVTVRRTDGPGSWQLTGPGTPAEVTGTLAGIAGWLTGRSSAEARTADGRPAPDLPAWL